MTILFGVYSVSSEALAYPLSKAASSNSDSSNDSSSFSKPNKPSRRTESVSRTVSSPMAPGTHNVSIGIGQVFLFGDPSSHGENAIGFNGTYTYGVSDLFAFQADAGYSSHTLAPATITATNATQSFSVTHLAAGLRSNLIYFDQLVPFINVGLGFYNPSITYSDNATLSTVLFGLELGMGLDLFVTNTVFFGTRLTYNDMFSSTKQDSKNNSHPVGGSFVSFMIHAGLAF